MELPGTLIQERTCGNEINNAVSEAKPRNAEEMRNVVERWTGIPVHRCEAVLRDGSYTTKY